MSTDSLAPTTTLQDDLVTAGQRRVNLIWEYTQSFIAINVVLANLVVSIYMVVARSTAEHPTMLSSALFLIVGFYFSRTNHSSIGGVGRKPTQIYNGR